MNGTNNCVTEIKMSSENKLNACLDKLPEVSDKKQHISMQD